jgi:methionyl-tRNA formyltransferase
MRLGVAATPEVALPTLKWLQTSGHTLVRVISQPDKPSGRGQEMHSSPVSQWAKSNSKELVNPALRVVREIATGHLHLLRIRLNGECTLRTVHSGCLRQRCLG